MGTIPTSMYYEARRFQQSWYGIVYHYGEDWDKEISYYRTALVDTEAEAYDLVTDWLEEQGIEAQMS